MAREQTKTPEQPPPPATPKGSRTKQFLVLVLFVLVGQVAIGYWAVFHVFLPKLTGEPSEETGVEAERAAEVEEEAGGQEGGGEGAEGHGEGGGEEEKNPKVSGDLLDVGDVTTSTTQGGELHYVILNAKIKFNAHETALEAGCNVSRIKDLILRIVSLKPGQDLDDVQDQGRLRDEIREAVNGVLTKGRAEEVYFTQYIYQ